MTRSAGPTPAEKLEQCHANLKQIGSALEMYSTDNVGRYPDLGLPPLPQHPSDINELPLRLDLEQARQLDPYFSQSRPVCPAGGTYRLVTQSNYDNYRVSCVGQRHRDAGVEGPDLPQYTGVAGLDTRTTRR